MSLQGQLEDLNLADVFDMIHLSRKSGVLIVSGHGAGEGRVVFHQGQILYASVFNREKLGERLIRQGFLQESELEEALRIQKERRVFEPLGTILAERRAVSQDILETVVREQLKEVVSELLSWERGMFRFDPEGHVAEKGTEERRLQVLLGTGISPEYLMLEGARLRDEESLSGSSGLGPVVTPSPLPEPAVPVSAPSSRDFPHFLALTRELMGARHPSEVMLIVLRFASEVLGRVLMLTVHDKELMGFGQSGFSFPGGEEEGVRKIRIPLAEPSMFGAALRTGIYRGEMSDCNWVRLLPPDENGETPGEVFVAPLMGRKGIRAFLYGDDLPRRCGIGPTEDLEVFIQAASVILKTLEE